MLTAIQTVVFAVICHNRTQFHFTCCVRSIVNGVLIVRKSGTVGQGDTHVHVCAGPRGSQVSSTKDQINPKG